MRVEMFAAVIFAIGIGRGELSCRSADGGGHYRTVDEHALEDICEFRVEGRVPEDKELSIARFEGTQDCAVKYGEKRMKLSA